MNLPKTEEEWMSWLKMVEQKWRDRLADPTNLYQDLDQIYLNIILIYQDIVTMLIPATISESNGFFSSKEQL